MRDHFDNREPRHYLKLLRDMLNRDFKPSVVDRIMDEIATYEPSNRDEIMQAYAQVTPRFYKALTSRLKTP